MPTLNLTNINKLFYSSTEAQKLYKGNQRLYPPNIEIPFSANREGLFYYLGTNGNTGSWVNPLTAGRFSATLINSIGNEVSTIFGGSLASFFDRSTSNQYLYANVGIGARINIDPPFKFKASKFSWKTANNSANHKNFNIRAWNNTQTFSEATTLLSITNLPILETNTWYDYDISNSNFWDNYAYVFLGASNSSSDGFIRGAEMEFFGDIWID